MREEQRLAVEAAGGGAALSRREEQRLAVEAAGGGAALSRREEQRLAVEAWEALFRAQTVLFRRFSAAPVWQGRSTREYDVLYQLSLSGEEGVRQRDLMDRLMISQPSLSRLVDKLVGEGLVLRCPDPRDGRGALLSLSDSGLAVQRRIGAGHAKDVARAMSERLDPEELRRLRALAEKLVGDDGGGTR
ncbi:MarR family transcriptional regulator [Leucobacter sp. CSA1]|uniref:MarR family transcriptional regulator n=1 Tax=Leucobacter chromiisoli TaxID=2796471 RepID=A0A934UVX9_9MICO|nr:MarR family transcriptional regulator [Leucobacter chromiisoli]MBK0419688.1 MarR family transcriptional regulator [Leucobacter chromiisoli]